MFLIFQCGNVNWLQIIRNGNIESMESANWKWDSLRLYDSVRFFRLYKIHYTMYCIHKWNWMYARYSPFFSPHVQCTRIYIHCRCVCITCGLTLCLNGSHFDLEYVQFAVWCVTVSDHHYIYIYHIVKGKTATTANYFSEICHTVEWQGWMESPHELLCTSIVPP